MKKLLLFSLAIVCTHNSSATTALQVDTTPVAGTYYPIYNEGPGQYVEPTIKMPFDKVSTLFIAFAHAYPTKNSGATLELEEHQDKEASRLPYLKYIAHSVNKDIKIIISLGWGHHDWTYISNDLHNNTNEFVPSVIKFIRKYDLDGFDIDDEEINGSSGVITQKDFDTVIQNLRVALDEAGKKDNKHYYLTIAPGYKVGNIDIDNMNNFDYIDTQNYGGSTPADIEQLGYPANQIVQGIDTDGCDTDLPADYKGTAGIFSWNMTSDYGYCHSKYTIDIANAVGYPPKKPAI